MSVIRIFHQLTTRIDQGSLNARSRNLTTVCRGTIIPGRAHPRVRCTPPLKSPVIRWDSYFLLNFLGITSCFDEEKERWNGSLELHPDYVQTSAAHLCFAL